MSRELDCLTSQKTLVTQSLSYTEKEIVQFNKTKNCLELSLNGLGIKKTNDENLKFGLELLKIEFGILSVDSDLSRELLEIGRNHVPKYEEKLKILFTENNLTFNLIEN